MGKYSNHSTEVATGGIGLPTILFLIFLVLKLTGTITWSWWWVTAPLWGGFALIIGIILIALAIYALIGLIAIISAYIKR